MKSLVPLVLLVGMFAAGCATSKDNFMAGASSAPQKSMPAEIKTKNIANALKPPSDHASVLPIIVTPDNSLAGKVLAYNSPGHFVVLDFPAGPMPKMNQTLFVYRAGLKVAEVKITGPQRDNDTVADIVNGDAQTGDEVRDQ